MKKVKPDAYYNDGFFEVARYGDVVSAINNMTKSQHDELVEKLVNSYFDSVKEINSIVSTIRSLIQGTEPSNLLNYVFTMNLMCSLNKESEADYSSDLNAQLRSLEYIQSVIVSSRYLRSEDRTERTVEVTHLKIYTHGSFVLECVLHRRDDGLHIDSIFEFKIVSIRRIVVLLYIGSR